MVSGGNASSLPLVGGKPEPTIKELSSPGRRSKIRCTWSKNQPWVS